MIWSNIEPEVEDFELADGSCINALILGEEYKIILPVYPGEYISSGHNEDKYIGSTHKGNIRISDGDDGYMYLILSSEGKDVLKRDGKIEITDLESIEVLGTGRSSEKGNRYQVRVLRVLQSSFVRIRYQGCNDFMVLFIDNEEQKVIHLGGDFETLFISREILELDIPGFSYERKRFFDQSLWFYI